MHFCIFVFYYHFLYDSTSLWENEVKKAVGLDIFRVKVVVVLSSNFLFLLTTVQLRYIHTYGLCLLGGGTVPVPVSGTGIVIVIVIGAKFLAWISYGTLSIAS